MSSLIFMGDAMIIMMSLTFISWLKYSINVFLIYVPALGK